MRDLFSIMPKPPIFIVAIIGVDTFIGFSYRFFISVKGAIKAIAKVVLAYILMVPI